MLKTFVVDEASNPSRRNGVAKLTVNLIPPPVVMNGIEMPGMGMPLQIELENPTAADIAMWVGGATVTGTFEVTAPPVAAPVAPGVVTPAK